MDYHSVFRVAEYISFKVPKTSFVITDDTDVTSSAVSAVPGAWHARSVCGRLAAVPFSHSPLQTRARRRRSCIRTLRMARQTVR